MKRIIECPALFTHKRGSRAFNSMTRIVNCILTAKHTEVRCGLAEITFFLNSCRNGWFMACSEQQEVDKLHAPTSDWFSYSYYSVY